MVAEALTCGPNTQPGVAQACRMQLNSTQCELVVRFPMELTLHAGPACHATERVGSGGSGHLCDVCAPDTRLPGRIFPGRLLGSSGWQSCSATVAWRSPTQTWA